MAGTDFSRGYVLAATGEAARAGRLPGARRAMVASSSMSFRSAISVVVATFGNCDTPDQWVPPLHILSEVVLPAML